jgi:hypothetical protein
MAIAKNPGGHRKSEQKAEAFIGAAGKGSDESTAHENKKPIPQLRARIDKGRCQARRDERLAWVQQAPEPHNMYAASLGQYVFEINKAPEPGTGYLLQMGQTRSEDWPLVVWEMDG